MYVCCVSVCKERGHASSLRPGQSSDKGILSFS